MSYVYTNETLQQLHFAGINSQRSVELIHGFPYRNVFMKKMQPNQPPHKLDGMGHEDTEIIRQDTEFSDSKQETSQHALPIAGNYKKKDPLRYGKKVFDANNTSTLLFINETAAEKPQDIQSPKLNRSHHRCIATPEDEEKCFIRTYTCTDPKTGRTEMLTSRRSGFAALDVYLNNFDVYASHKNRRLLAPCGLATTSKHLNFNTYESKEILPRPSKSFARQTSDSIVASNGFLSGTQLPNLKETLGCLRRKFIDKNLDNLSFNLDRPEPHCEFTNTEVPSEQPNVEPLSLNEESGEIIGNTID